MLSVALTGNVAAGKSAVADVWREAGIPVVSADDLSREVTAPGTPGLAEVVDAFGGEVLRADGTLDRSRLRARVFGDEEARRRLESILHPRIGAARRRWTEERRREGAAVVAAEIPLLFETGTEGEYDVVVFVDAPEAERLRRLRETRGLEEEEARRIMEAQMPAPEKRERAHLVLENSGTLADLRARALVALDLLRARAVPREEG